MVVPALHPAPQPLPAIPVTCCSYAAYKNPPGVWQGQHTTLTIFRMFVQRTTWLKRSVRTSNDICKLSGQGDAMIPLSVYTYAATSCTVLTSPSSPASS